MIIVTSKLKHQLNYVFALLQIFIPDNNQGVYLYLKVVDILERKLVLLDYLPCPARNDLRRQEVLKLMCILHSIYFITYYYAYVTKVCNLLVAIFIEEI